MALRGRRRPRDVGRRVRLRAGEKHTYRDGNKRIGFLAIATFLGINGCELQATDAEVVAEIVTLADGRVSEAQLADWIRAHSAKRK